MAASTAGPSVDRREDLPSGEEDVRPLRMCKEDRRKLYGLLEADLPARTKRIEYMLIALLAGTGYRLVSGLPIEQAPAAIFRFIFG